MKKKILALAAFAAVFVANALAVTEHMTFSSSSGSFSVHTNLNWESPSSSRYGSVNYTIYRKVPYVVNGITYYDYEWIADTYMDFYNGTSSANLTFYGADSMNSDHTFNAYAGGDPWNQYGDGSLYLHGLDPGSYVIEVSTPGYEFSGSPGSWSLNWSENYDGNYGSLWMYVSS